MSRPFHPSARQRWLWHVTGLDVWGAMICFRIAGRFNGWGIRLNEAARQHQARLVEDLLS